MSNPGAPALQMAPLLYPDDPTIPNSSGVDRRVGRNVVGRHYLDGFGTADVAATGLFDRVEQAGKVASFREGMTAEVNEEHYSPFLGEGAASKVNKLAEYLLAGVK